MLRVKQNDEGLRILEELFNGLKENYATLYIIITQSYWSFVWTFLLLLNTTK